MEHQLYKAIVGLLPTLGHPATPAIYTFSDEEVVRVFYWAAIHDRPVCWACDRDNWPIHLRSRPLPSGSTLSRRLRSGSARALLLALERRVTAPKGPGLFWMIDGKPLPIGGCSKDRQAGYGRAAGCMAKGYKLHALAGGDGALAAWLVAPMNGDERTMARRLLRRAGVQGYVVGDSNYDSNPLHALCDGLGLQLVAPRRRGRGPGGGAAAAGWATARTPPGGGGRWR